MYYKKEIGKTGEDIAANYLEEEGCTIIERNFNCWWGEIDIIALDKNEIVFVEVKTRTGSKYGCPIEAVNNIKIRHLRKTIEYYLYLKKLYNKFIRVDVIEVYFKKQNIKINHIKKIM